MAKTTAAITLTSSDLTSDALSLSKTATLYKAGTTDGLDQTTGIGRKTTTAVTQYTIVAQTDYTDDKNHQVYLFNPSVITTEWFKVHIGTVELGRLYAGDWLKFPYTGGQDIKITPSVATSMTLEHLVISEA
jgi:hypothetical protein